MTFWGAAHSVTGSMHLVHAAGRTILLDCGLVRGPHTEARPYHGHFPFDPARLDAVVLSHAHIDHCGNLPHLVRQGYNGPIYCTVATRDLVALMLGNSARIHAEGAHVRNVIGKAHVQDRPVFTQADVDRTIEQCVFTPYGEPVEIAEGIWLRLSDAGHILGSAVVSMRVAAGGSLAFTGDLGRRQPLLLRPPAPLPMADLWISESTYGDRTVEASAVAEAALGDVVRRTVERGGKVLIPSFSLGRMQAVVYALQRQMESGRAPRVPVYVDSGLAAAIAAVYRNHAHDLADEAAARSRASQLLDGEGIRYVATPEEGRELDALREPCVILAPGGMCEGGRILQHLKQHIDDPRCSVALVNYQAPHTPGRQLLERGPTVRFHGRKWNKWAEVVSLAGFSGHADHDDLLAQLGPLARTTAKVRLVHGEPEQAAALAIALHERGFSDVAVPALGESVLL